DGPHPYRPAQPPQHPGHGNRPDRSVSERASGDFPKGLDRSKTVFENTGTGLNNRGGCWGSDGYLRFSISSVSWGTTWWRSPTTPKSASSKMGASGSLLMATMVLAVCMP